MKSELKKLREQFREWYAILSVSEIVKNRTLIQSIESLETKLSAMVT